MDKQLNGFISFDLLSDAMWDDNPRLLKLYLDNYMEEIPTSFIDEMAFKAYDENLIMQAMDYCREGYTADSIENAYDSGHVSENVMYRMLDNLNGDVPFDMLMDFAESTVSREFVRAFALKCREKASLDDIIDLIDIFEGAEILDCIEPVVAQLGTKDSAKLREYIEDNY